MSRVIGIDLGTTNSVVAFVENGKPEAIPNAQGSRLTPSVVMFKDGDEPVVGELAKRQLLTAPGYGVRSAKRIIGQRYSEVADRIEDFPYRVIEAEEGRAEIQLDGDRVVSPEEVGAHVLASLRDAAEDYLGESVDQAVITVPAYFNDAQRTATKRAAEMAGIEVLRLLNEPTAAALAYGAGKQNDEIVAVFDFGGGTFDISILQLQDDIFEVLATCGDTNLGGDNLDIVLFTDICDGIIQSTGIDPTQDPQATARIHEAAEKAKIELSNMEQTEISLPFIVADKNGPKHFSKSLSREQFIRMVTPVLERLIPPCKQAMSDAGVGPEKIRNVLLVGGSTRIPRVQEMVKELFRREPNRSVNPDEVVALGAAVQASAMTGALQELLLLDVTPLSLGIEVAGGAFKPLIARNSSIPCEATRKFATVVDNQTSVLVNVLQGERKIASENRLLARFRLTGIAPMPAELAEIQVRFNIDANGILQVTAVDLTSGVETGVVIEGYGQLAMDKREIQRAVEEASKSAIEDEQFIQFADRKAKADRLQAQVNQMLELAADAILEEDMKTIKETIFRHDLAIRDRNLRAMEEQEDKLNDLLGKYEAAIKIGVELMKKAKAREQFSTGGAPRLEDQIRAQSAAEQQQDVPPTPPEQMMQEVPGQPEPTGGAEKSELHKVARRGGDPTAEPEIYEQAKNLAALPPPPPPPPRRKG